MKRGCGAVCTHTTPVQNLTVEQLRRAVAIKEQIEALKVEVAAIAKGWGFSSTANGRGRKKMGLIAVAARWAKARADGETEPKKRRKFSAAHRAKIAAAAALVKVRVVKAEPAPKRRGRARSEELTSFAPGARAALLALADGSHGKIATLNPKRNRKMSATSRAKIAAAAKARWARFRTQGKKG